MRHRGATRRALVTGGNSGIGKAILTELCERRWETEFCGRNTGTIQATMAEIVGSRGFRCDLRYPGSLSAWLDTVQESGPLDLVVNNAGLYHPASLAEQTTESLEELIATNLSAPIRLVQECLQRSMLRPGSSVNTISSVAAETVFDGCAVYGATKAGLAQAMRVARQELRSRDIRFCIIHPGATRTPAWGSLGDTEGQKLMSPESLAKVILAACLDHPDVVVEEMTVRPPTGDL